MSFISERVFFQKSPPHTSLQAIRYGWYCTSWMLVSGYEKCYSNQWERFEHRHARIRTICLFTASCKVSFKKNIFLHIGLHFVAEVQLCSHENAAQTVLRYGFWPMTPIEPKTIVAIGLMESFRCLSLEAHLSAHSFCNHLTHKYLKYPGYIPLVGKFCTWKIYFYK